MNPFRYSQARHALYWVLGLTVIVAAGFVVYRWILSDDARLQKKVAETKLLVKNFHTALLHYESEYAFPSPASPDYDSTSRGDIIDTLQGDNSRKVVFIELPMAIEGECGLIRVGSQWVLVDSWGQELIIVWDGDNNRVTNPEAKANARRLSEHPQPLELQTTIAVYSAGADRDPQTWHDNICSWRQ